MTKCLVALAPAAALLLALLAAGGLAWQVRDLPLAPAGLAGLLRVDALSAFFALLTLLAALVRLAAGGERPWRILLATAVVLPTYATTSLLLVALGFLLAALVEARFERRWLRDLTATGPHLLSSACLGAAAAALWFQSGTWRYDLPASGAGLTSLVFWGALLAAVQFWAFDLRTWLGSGWRPGLPALPNLILAAAWFYPLIRLYSLGPWNLGWLFATLLLGGAAALWAAWHALAATEPQARAGGLVRVPLGLALAGVGLGSGAGLVAAGYALLVALLLTLALEQSAAHREDTPPARDATLETGAIWLLSGAFPLTAPFVAAWMGVGAAAAGGVWLLAGALWLAALLAALAMVRTAGAAAPAPGWRLPLAAGLSLGIGAGAPGVVAWLLLPLARQLQGGLTPFGDVTLWPWGGLVALNAARQTVATLPSVALAVLMLVLGALAWLVTRLLTILRESRS